MLQGNNRLIEVGLVRLAHRFTATLALTAKSVSSIAGRLAAHLRSELPGGGEQRRRDDRLLETIDAVGFGTLDWNTDAGTVECSPCLLLMLGLDADGTTTVPAAHIHDRTHVDDRPALLRAMKTAQAQESAFRTEYRITRANTGEVRWLRASWRYQRAKADSSARFTGVVRDISDSKQIEADLLVSETRYRAAFAVGRIASWETNFVTGERSWSPEGEALFGLRLHDGAGHVGGPDDEYRNALHPDDKHLAANFHVLAETDDNFATEYRIVRPDQSVIWVCGCGRVVSRDANSKPIKLISVVADVTTRKTAEQHLDFVVAETAHRAKNLLNVVQAIARQTARTSQCPKEFNEAFSRRLHGMALSQDILVGQLRRQAPLRDLVRKHLMPFVDEESDQLTIEGPAVAVSTHCAEALGLALHELATNAAKYGALSSAEGHVSVCWKFDRDDPAGLHMTWTESGGPVVVPPTSTGFGHKVISVMVAQLTAGHVEIAYPPSGFAWSVKLPTSALASGSANETSTSVSR